MRTTRLASLGGVAAVAALAVTGWLAPAWGQAVPHAKAAADTMSMRPAAATSLADQLAAARQATAKYSTNLARAKADGYFIIT